VGRERARFVFVVRVETPPCAIGGRCAARAGGGRDWKTTPSGPKAGTAKRRPLQVRGAHKFQRVMCGIVGISGTELMENAAARDLIARMLGVIEHRGPDDDGYYVEPGVAMGMRGLAIIDLATGRQPISNEDGSSWIVFNAE